MVSCVKKPRRVCRPQAAKKVEVFSLATCAREKILLRLQVWNLRAADCKPFVGKTHGFSDRAVLHLNFSARPADQIHPDRADAQQNDVHDRHDVCLQRVGLKRVLRQKQRARPGCRRAQEHERGRSFKSSTITSSCVCARARKCPETYRTKSPGRLSMCSVSGQDAGAAGGHARCSAARPDCAQ